MVTWKTLSTCYCFLCLVSLYTHQFQHTSFNKSIAIRPTISAIWTCSLKKFAFQHRYCDLVGMGSQSCLFHLCVNRTWTRWDRVVWGALLSCKGVVALDHGGGRKCGKKRRFRCVFSHSFGARCAECIVQVPVPSYLCLLHITGSITSGGLWLYRI